MVRTSKGVRLSEKLQLTAALCNDILTAVSNIKGVVIKGN